MTQLDAARKCRTYFMKKEKGASCPKLKAIYLKRLKECQKLISDIHKNKGN